MKQNKLWPSNERIITLSEFQRIWKEAFVTNLDVRSLPRTKEYEKHFQSKSGFLVDYVTKLPNTTLEVTPREQACSPCQLNYFPSSPMVLVLYSLITLVRTSRLYL